MPPQKVGFDAQVIYWVRSSERASGLDEHLGETVRAFVAREFSWWPRVAFPGRDHPWEEYLALPDAS